MTTQIEINGRIIGTGFPTFIIAEMSANHHQDFDEAVRIISVAKECGAEAVKLQTYTPDTMTIDSDNEYFKIKGTAWEGDTLYSLYQRAYTPWEWQPRLKEEADKLGIILFSTPFDKTAVDFLNKMNVPAFKVASFELVDIPLIEYIAKQGKPVILSTGMGTLIEIEEAIQAIRKNDNQQLILLKCISDYPSRPKDMNLRTIPNIVERFRVPAGLSDHTLGHDVSVAAVVLGACIIEKHLTLSRDEGGPDAAFSMEPYEFKAMVQAVRQVEKALGSVKYDPAARELQNKVFRRSLFVVKDVRAGDPVTSKNVRSIRPGYGLPPKYISEIIGRKFRRNVVRGTPMKWDLI